MRVLKPFIIPHTDFPHREIYNNPAPEIDEEGFEIFEVAEILDHRIRRPTRYRTGFTEFLVTFTGYDHTHDQWIPEDLLKAPDILAAYKTSRNIATLSYCAGGVL